MAADSRAHNFDIYSKFGDLDIQYNIKRGAKIINLLSSTLELVRSAPKDRPLVVKIAAGINNSTTLIYTKTGRIIKFNGISASRILSQLVAFKSLIHIARQDALVGFINVPTASIRKFQEKLGGSDKYLSEAEIVSNQEGIDNCIDNLNCGIREENRRVQAGYNRGPYNISWDTYIRKRQKRRNSKGVARTTRLRNLFHRLYDGLHGNPELKHKWYLNFCRIVEKEIREVVQQQARP